MTKKADTIFIIAKRDDLHADEIVEKCYINNIPVIRIDPEDSWPKFSKIEIEINSTNNSIFLNWNGKILDPNKIKSIYCRDLLFAKKGKNNDISALLHFAESKAALKGFLLLMKQKLWVNFPWYDELYDDKIFQIECGKLAGFKIPRTLVTNNPKKFMQFYMKCNENVIIKQLSEICLIEEVRTLNKKENVIESTAYGFYTKKILPEHLKNIDEIVSTPCLFQEHIEKKADIRATVVGGKIFSAYIDSQSSKNSVVDFRQNLNLPLRKFELPLKIEQKLIRMINSWGLKFAACDFILDKNNNFLFLEANVEGNWLWIEDELELGITNEIFNLLNV